MQWRRQRTRTMSHLFSKTWSAGKCSTLQAAPFCAWNRSALWGRSSCLSWHSALKWLNTVSQTTFEVWTKGKTLIFRASVKSYSIETNGGQLRGGRVPGTPVSSVSLLRWPPPGPSFPPLLVPFPPDMAFSLKPFASYPPLHPRRFAEHLLWAPLWVILLMLNQYQLVTIYSPGVHKPPSL